MKAEILRNAYGKSKADEKGVLVFDSYGKISSMSPDAIHFLQEQNWEVLDGYLRPLNYMDKKGLNMIKSRFLTTAAHEFRTPLSTVLSSAALAESYLSEGNIQRAVTHLEKIKRAALQITDVLTDFLSLSKVESGKVKWQPEPFDSQGIRILNAGKLQAMPS